MFRAPDLKKMLRVFRGEEFQGTEFGWGIMVGGGNGKNAGRAWYLGTVAEGVTQYAEEDAVHI